MDLQGLLEVSDSLRIFLQLRYVVTESFIDTYCVRDAY